MKFGRRSVAALLLVCMLLSMMPPFSFVRAAEDTAGYQYVLDTDGIDVGAQYLIVSGTGASASALRMDPATSWQTSQSAVTVQGGDTITAFENDYNCQWTFSSATNGTVSSNGYYLNIDQYARYQTGSATLQFANLGGGSYRIYLHGGSNTNLQYLDCANTTEGMKWQTSYYWGVTGNTTESAVSRVYLFKRIEVDLGCSVTYDGNGNTQGLVPEGVTGLVKGSEYTLLAPQEELRKDVGNDTYLFRGWNTAADGSGTEYSVGQTITVSEDLTLYAEWYLQTKYAVTVIADLDGVPTDLAEITGRNISLYVGKEGEDGSLLPLTQVEAGIYRTYVTENGTYLVYAQFEGGDLESEHGHKVVIYNQDGSTELLNYSVSYDVNGGAWNPGEDPGKSNYHANTHVQATQNIPVRDGYTFVGWKNQNGDSIAAGGHVSDAITETTVLTAQWEENVDVTVNVTVNHGTLENHDDTVVFELLRLENGVNLPVQEVTLDVQHESFVHDESTNTTTYTYKLDNMEMAHYHVSCAKSHYDVKITYNEVGGVGGQVIAIELTYAPQSFDLDFQVKVNHTPETKAMMPQAVNVKITAWDGSSWKVISQQADIAAPLTVFIDEDGNGSGFFPVWQYWPDSNNEPGYYRVDVTSFVMPDGTILPAVGQNSQIYTPDGSGLYTATVTVEAGTDGGNGGIPQYPEAATLPGAYFDGSGNEQSGIPTVTVDITPFTVTFLAGEGKLNGQDKLVLSGQYAYPNIHDYVPVPKDEGVSFSGWYYSDGTPAENLNGKYLTEDVVYEAKYGMPATVQGTVTINATYEENGETVTINGIDRPKEVLVVLQKNINGVHNDVDSQLVTLTYDGVVGTGSYSFHHPNDGTDYWITVLSHNYTTGYDNNGDGKFSPEEDDAYVGADGKAEVDVYLRLAPECYNQWCVVDASKIGKGLRPKDALVQVLYRDLGDIHSYNVIAQHETEETKGLRIPLEDNATGSGFEDLWKWHTNGTLYEYQLRLHTLYGNVEGAYSSEGTAFSKDAPFTVTYGAPSFWDGDKAARTLQATLIPKQYEIVFDLNLGDSGDTVQGMEKFHMDAGTGNDHYAYLHTWSFEDNITAFPYRDGFVFEGWESSDDSVQVTDQGTIHVGAVTAQTVTLTARWTQLSGTDYTVRHLELNTDKVLHGAQAVTGAVVEKVVAADKAFAIEGYTYAGAMIRGTYYDKSENPAMTISQDPLENLMVIYYLPDGSDGYTEQVESNLHLDKTAVLENNGTYTINMETYTMDNPITTYIQQDTPLDIVLVLDQSGSIIQSGYLDELQSAVNNFVTQIADHGREHEVDHRIAVVGYAGDDDEPPTSTDTNSYPIAGGNTTNWVNTGVFDSNGDFHPYPVTGFNYTEYTENPDASGTYYTYSEGEYLLLTYHKEYRHLLTADEARIASMEGRTVYGYINGGFVELTRNSSGLWLYGDKQLYSLPEFFTFHEDVWTHRKGLERRQIHAYGTGAAYTCTDGHGNLYVRTETREADPQLSIYHDALVPVSVGAYGSGGVNPGLTKSTSHLGSNGGTFVQYGIEMANRVFEANPLDPAEGRVRIMVVFTDGMPGIGTFDEATANAAIEKAYVTKNTHGAYSYAIGLYSNSSVASNSDQGFFMNGLSSNYSQAKSLEDVQAKDNYEVAADGTNLNSGGPYYVLVNGQYRQLSFESSGYFWRQYGWTYTVNNQKYYLVGPNNSSSTRNQYVSNGQVNGHTIYKKLDVSYKPADGEGYYSTTTSEKELIEYFANLVKEITTKITTEIILDNDTILRDIMGQGLELTDGTVITAYTQYGKYNAETKQIDWAVNAQGEPELEEKVSLTVGSGKTSVTDEESGVSIHVYNLDKENTTNPAAADYHPHAVDVTGYNFADWYINETNHTEGYKMVVKITRVEARDDVVWGRSTDTNEASSGLWLPADQQGNRELLLPFDQPSTIFVERAYVLDYGKEFTLSGWYFDDENGKNAEPIHVDCNIADGMNWFDTAAPNIANSASGDYGNTNYGNVQIKDGEVTYSPVTMNWGGYDQFYVFGNTWRNTVVTQDANENGNLWNKVTVIPANNVYYEDSFITADGTGSNGVEGFVFSGTGWIVESTEDANSNREQPEHQEKTPYGDVHGWTDDLANDLGYSDGSAHVAGTDGKIGAEASFTFTGTGVDVYTRTNADSGLIFAFLTEVGDNGDGVTTQKTQIIDNLAVSGDYYQIPSVSFMGLPYGTYKVELLAMAIDTATENMRYEYVLDGIRVYNPLGSSQVAAEAVVKEAYGMEQNAVFTEIRDVLLEYKDFNKDMQDEPSTGLGAVFIDWIQPGQEGEGDSAGKGVPTYQVGTFETYGPKNEVYLSKGQALVLKVDPNNHYYVGLKTLNTDGGKAAVANVSGLDRAEPVSVTVSHTTDMYYQVTPVDGYIVIENGSSDDAILSVTKLRTTNYMDATAGNGIVGVQAQEAIQVMANFRETMEQLANRPPEQEELSLGEKLAAGIMRTAEQIFGSVRAWLKQV